MIIIFLLLIILILLLLLILIIISYDQALKIDSKKSEAWCNKGSAFDDLGKKELAIDWLFIFINLLFFIFIDNNIFIINNINIIIIININYY